ARWLGRCPSSAALYSAIPVPDRLAWYIATSAQRNSVSASCPCSGATAMPMLASTAIGWPSSTNGVCKTCTRSSATCAARAVSPGQQYGEFVAAKPRNQISGLERALEALTDLLEQGIANPMPDGV